MACLIDQVVVFDETGHGVVTCPSSFPGEPSDFSVSIDGQNLNYIGFNDAGYPVYAKGGTIEAPILPYVDFTSDLDGCRFFAYESYGNPFVGEYRVSMCSSESDDDSCPDVPFSESAPEKYADYFDEDGNFVPKASSGGDCALSFAKLTLTTSDGEGDFYLANPKFSALAPAGSFPFISSDVIFTITSSEVGVYDVPLYNGIGVLRFDLMNSSDSISIGEGSSIELAYSQNLIRFYKITGDATLILPPDSGV